jgi:hypothetical protein
MPPDPVEKLIEDNRRRGADPDFLTAGLAGSGRPTFRTKSTSRPSKRSGE